MKPITNEIVQELEKRGLSLDQYTGDSVVKALLDADFEHDFILKSIDNGEIETLNKSKYTVAEETRYDEKKAGEHERRDWEEGKKTGEKEEKKKIEEEDDDEEIEKKKKDKKDKEDMEKAMTADFMKSQRQFFTEFSDFMEDMKEMKSIMKSMQEDIQAVKGQPMPFRNVPSGAVLEKSMGVKTTEAGKRVLSKSMHREPIKRIMTECFEKMEDSDLKKSLASDIISFSAGSMNLSGMTIDYLNKQGIEIAE